MLDESIKAGGKKVIPAEDVAEGEEDAEVVDLVAALQRSLEQSSKKKKTG
jgi:DNA end-binding protein Ku